MGGLISELWEKERQLLDLCFKLNKILFPLHQNSINCVFRRPFHHLHYLANKYIFAY